jgi:hypothetical protein
MSQGNDDIIPYASKGTQESWFSRRSRGAGLRIIGIALMGIAAIYAESNNSGDLFIFNIAKTIFLVTVVAFALEFVLSFFQ